MVFLCPGYNLFSGKHCTQDSVFSVHLHVSCREFSKLVSDNIVNPIQNVEIFYRGAPVKKYPDQNLILFNFECFCLEF